MNYSIVIPVYNSGHVLRKLYEEISAAMSTTGKEYEIVFVNDDSTDTTANVLLKIAASDNRVRVLTHEKNFGQTTATFCGIEHARADSIITMDDDLQYSPADIPRLIQQYEKGGHAILFGVVKERQKTATYTLLPVAAKFFFNFFILPSHRHITYFSSFRIFSRKKLTDFMPKGMNVYFVWEIPPDAIGNIEVVHQKTERGASNYNLWKFIRFFSLYILWSVRKTVKVLFLGLLLSAGIVYVSGGLTISPEKIAGYLLAAALLSLLFILTGKSIGRKRTPHYSLLK